MTRGSRFVIAAALAVLLPAERVLHSGAGAQNRASMYVAVGDNRGRPVAGLTAADFGVWIDGRPQEILSAAPATDPAAVVLLTDRLGSVNTYSHVDVQRALAGFVAGIRAGVPGSQFALTTFDGPVVRVSSFASPPAELDKQIGRLTTIATDAALLDALTDACKIIGSAPSRRRVIFLVFAGYRQDSSTASSELVGTMLQASGASLWAIEARLPGENVFGQVNRDNVVGRGTGVTGGRRDAVASAIGVETMAKQMAALIASQYLVTYGPGGGNANTERKVAVKRSDVHVYAPAWLTR